MKLLYTGVVVALIASSTGCSLFRNPCGSVMPAVVATQGKLADVQRALSELERSNIRDSIQNYSDKTRYDQAMRKAWEAYDLAVRTTALASESCSQPSVAGLLKDIADAWTVLRGFVSLFGGTAHSAAIEDPVVWSPQ